MRPRLTAIACALALSLSGPALADQDDVTPGLDVDLGFLPVDGDTPYAVPPSGQPLRIRVALTDALTGRAASDRRLTAWLRPADPANSTCQAAVGAFRSTRALPGSAVDLNGILVVARNSDATLHVSDPRLGNRAANLTAAHALPETPAAVVADSHAMRILVALPGQGEVLALSPISADRQTLLSGLAGVAGIEPLQDGRFWVAAPGRISLHAPDGTQISQTAIDGTPQLLPTRIPDPRGYGPPVLRRLGAFTPAGELLILDPEGGVTARLREDILADAALLDGGAVLALPMDGASVRLRYADDPDRAETLALPARASRLAAHPGGRFVVAWQPGAPEMTLIDSAALTAQAIRPPRAGTVAGLITTTGGALSLSLDGGLVQVIDLDRVLDDPGYDPPTVNLGDASTPDAALMAQGGPLLVSLSPSPNALALDPARQLAWLIEDGLTTETPAMDSLRLRTGMPQGLHVLDRSFRRTGPGIYETTAALPAGPQELVLAGSDPPFARCISFRAEGEPDHVPAILLRATLSEGERMQPGRKGLIVLHLTDAEGRDRAPGQMPLLLTSLTGSDRQIARAMRRPGGGLQVEVTFPVPGSYAVQPMQMPQGYRLNATPVIEVEMP